MPLITINQVQKYYGDNHVLKGVDLDIDMGQVISIIGRSGSGNSTLLRFINGSATTIFEPSAKTPASSPAL